MIIRPVDDDIVLLLLLKEPSWINSLDDLRHGVIEVQTEDKELAEDCIRDGDKLYLVIRRIKKENRTTPECFFESLTSYLSRENYKFDRLKKLKVPPTIFRGIPAYGYIEVAFNG